MDTFHGDIHQVAGQRSRVGEPTEPWWLEHRGRVHEGRRTNTGNPEMPMKLTEEAAECAKPRMDEQLPVYELARPKASIH